jgi:hypothetical protein
MSTDCFAASSWLEARLRQPFAVLRVRLGEDLLPVRLPRLGEQDERRRVRGLQAEGEVEQDEGVDVEVRHPGGVAHHPDRHHDRLADQERRRTEEPREGFGSHGEPIVAEHRGEMRMRQRAGEVAASPGSPPSGAARPDPLRARSHHPAPAAPPSAGGPSRR